MAEARSAEWATWRMKFSRLIADDVVEASFANVHLRDETDVKEWERRVSRELGRFSKKVDLLINLAELHVHPRASSAFGSIRAGVLKRFARFSFRFGPDRWTATSISTSRVLHGASANVYPSREEALEALRAARAAAPQA